MNIAVIGCGSWGTAFARLMANEGHEVLLVCRGAEQAVAINAYHRNPRYLFDIALPVNWWPAISAAPISAAQTWW